MVDRFYEYEINWFKHKAKTNTLYIEDSIEDSDTAENWYILVQAPNKETIYLGYHKSFKRGKDFPSHVKTAKYPKAQSEHIKFEQNIEEYINKKRGSDKYQDYFSDCNFYVVGESKKEILCKIEPKIIRYIGASSEEEYQLSVENIIKNNDLISYSKEKNLIQKQQKTSFLYLRDAKISAFAKQKALYKCEFNSEHETFISEISGKQYVEAHHLIPMKYQNKFSVSLDIPENIVALCPNCHRAIHYATFSIKEKLISFLYNKQISKLKENDINISLKELLEMYKSL